MSDFVRELETRAFRAWPAKQVVDLEGWRLRWSEGVTRRGNSVFPEAASGATPLGERIERALAFYRERGVPPRFQITPVSAPDGLDAALADKGWEIEAPVSIQTVAARAAADTKRRTRAIEAEVLPGGEGDWFALAGERGRFAECPDVLRGFLERIGAAAGYALARLDGEPVAVALGVRDEAWVGVFSMRTLPEHRGRGAASALLRALGEWACREGARQLYLQVERDNPAALRLYHAAGFREVYGYHYRIAPD